MALILRRDIYATAAIAGSSLYMVLQTMGLNEIFAALIGMIIVVALRFAAILWGLHPPVFRLPDGDT